MGHDQRRYLTFLSRFNSGVMGTVFLLGQNFLSSDFEVLLYPSNFPFSFNDLMEGIKLAFLSVAPPPPGPFHTLQCEHTHLFPAGRDATKGTFPLSICLHHKLSEVENSVKRQKCRREGEQNKEK